MRLECGCPSTFPDWHKHDVNLGGQLIHSLAIPMFLHMPIGFEASVHRQQQLLEQLNLPERWPGLVLSRSSAWGGRIIRLLEDTLSPAHRLEYLPNPFHLRGYLNHGGIGTISRAVKQVQSDLLEQSLIPRELYLCYLTCPRCSEQRGGERILLLRRWVESSALKKRMGKASG